MVKKVFYMDPFCFCRIFFPNFIRVLSRAQVVFSIHNHTWTAFYSLRTISFFLFFSLAILPTAFFAEWHLLFIVEFLALFSERRGLVSHPILGT